MAASKVKIVADNRETKLIKLLGEDGCHEVKQLSVGDFVMSLDDRVLAIIERKSISDLAASLKDGRWREQKIRLKDEQQRHPGSRLIYVIEGGMNFNEHGMLYGIQSKALVSMIMNTMFKDSSSSIHVVFTSHIVDTSDFIVGLARRLPEWGAADHGTAVAAAAVVDSHQEAMIHAKKRDNVTGATVFAMQLCAVPGISPKKANLIREHLNVNCIADLVRVLSELDEKAAIKRLMTVPGIGKVLATDMYISIMSGLS